MNIQVFKLSRLAGFFNVVTESAPLQALKKVWRSIEQRQKPRRDKKQIPAKAESAQPTSQEIDALLRDLPKKELLEIRSFLLELHSQIGQST